MSEDDQRLPAPSLQFAMQIHADIGTPVQVGAAADGERIHFPITGGHVSGPDIEGTLLPGADRFLMRADGVPCIDALYEIRTEDGALITVHNSGPAVPASADALPHTTLRFTAPVGRHDWLNKAVFVGSIRASLDDGFVTVRVDRVL